MPTPAPPDAVRAIPLPTLLSHVLVAWTIEVDNAFEARAAHRTTAMRRRGEVLRGPWLVSFPLYIHCIRHLTADGLPLDELVERARVPRPVSGLDRWGYLTVGEAPRAVVRLTPAGLAAQAVWSALPDEVDARWDRRHGEATMSGLREALRAVEAGLDRELPDHLPGVRGSADLRLRLPHVERPSAPERTPPPAPLYALLTKVLLAFSLEYEREAAWSIALAANVLRVLDDVGVPVAGLHRHAGVSKEAMALSLTVATRDDLVAVEKPPGRRTRQARLTPHGVVARRRHLDLIGDVEHRWAERVGGAAIGRLRSSLEAIVVTTDLAASPLAEAYGPLPGTWRADVPVPATLPHHPMVVRGGGYPDGA